MKRVLFRYDIKISPPTKVKGDIEKYMMIITKNLLLRL
jgi:hypothetical protein